MILALGILSLRLAHRKDASKQANRQNSVKLLSIKMSLSTSLEDKVFEVKHDLVKLVGKNNQEFYTIFSTMV